MSDDVGIREFHINDAKRKVGQKAQTMRKVGFTKEEVIRIVKEAAEEGYDNPQPPIRHTFLKVRGV